MLKVFETSVCTSSDFDFVQAMLNNFLKNHQEIIVNEPELAEILQRIQTAVDDKFESLETLIESNICMSAYFAGINQF